MIAIIAGTGTLPLESCKYFLNKKTAFFVISLFEENRNEIAQLIQDQAQLIAKPLYKLGGIMQTLEDYKTTHLLFIGKVDKRNLLKKIKFDWFYFKLAAKILYKNDGAIMELLVETLTQRNIEVISQDSVLPSLFVAPGILTGTLTDHLKRDITMGIKTAKHLSKSDIGQTVAVKDGMILAVEAIEGTDSCIKRGIELGKENVVICKTAHENKNTKFDLPTLGPASLKNIKKGEVKVIAWQACKTLIAQKETFIRKAKELGITLVSVE